jgi:hypothetical protein
MKKSRWLMLGIALLFVTGCGKMMTDMMKWKTAAEAHADVFHHLFNGENFKGITDAADPGMFKVTSSAEVCELLATMRRKLGEAKTSETVNCQVNTVNGQTTVVLVQKTAFESGNGTETFSYRIVGEKPLLLGYNINSKDLIMK